MLIISFSINPSAQRPSCCINEGGGATARKAHLRRPFACTENILIIHKTPAWSVHTAGEQEWYISMFSSCCRASLSCSQLHSTRWLIFRTNTMVKMSESTLETGNVSSRLRQTLDSQQPTDVLTLSFNFIVPFLSHSCAIWIPPFNFTPLMCHFDRDARYVFVSMADKITDNVYIFIF